MSSDNFSYQPLDPQLRGIRLLTLSPGHQEDPLECQLLHASLTANPIYTALSYVWGEPASPEGPNIVLDGHTFPVTKNLFSALRHLRQPAEDDPLCLWVDAVCINQQDVDERSKQVAMMREIYELATQVIIWLGEEEGGSNAVFDAIPVVARRKCHRRNNAGIEDREPSADLMQQCGFFFFGLVDRRPWLSRVWILQELAMAKEDPIVACGWKQVSWSIFIKAWHVIAKESLSELGTRRKARDVVTKEEIVMSSSKGYVDEGDEEDDVEILSKGKLDVLDDLRQAVQSRGGDSLRKFLLISRTSAATDPRDRIYGLLGLLEKDAVDPRLSFTIPIDYRKPTAEVYTDAMAHIFSRGEGPYFLSGVFLPGISAAAPHIPWNPPTTKAPTLPSWVPDFSCQAADKATQPSGILFHPPAIMSASGAGSNCHNGRILGDSRTLQVEGLLVDTIEQVMPFGFTVDECVANLAYLESVTTCATQRHCLLNPSVAPLVNRFKNSEPLWKILISNKHLKSGYESAPSSYEDMYKHLLHLYQQDIPDGEELEYCDAETSQRSEYELCLQSNIGQKSFFTTKSGFVGTCVPDSRVGDVVAIVFGSPVPFILRPQVKTRLSASEERQTYSLIGASYVGGIMGGEMVDELYCEDLMDSTTFLIV